MQIISPDKVVRGTNAWQRSLPEIIKISKSPLLLGRSLSTRPFKFNSLKSLNINDLKDLVERLLPSSRGDFEIFTISSKDLCQAFLPLKTLSGEIICI